MNKDDMNEDAEFEAFLKGEGELARRLQALPQPSPGPALDAAILAHAKRAGVGPGEAANDAGHGAATPGPQRGLGRRWTIPAGIAASVLAGVFAHQAYQVAPSYVSDAATVPAVVAEPVIAASAPAARQAPAPVAESAPPAAAPVAEARASATPAPKRARPAAVRQKPAIPELPSNMPTMDAADADGPRFTRARSSGAAQQEKTAAPARMAETAAAAVPPPREQASPAAASPAPAPVAMRATNASPPLVEAQAGAWLSRIEAMLERGQSAEALAEWQKFHAAHPDYPVPDAVREKVEALRQ